MVDGVDMGAITSYTFKKVRSMHTIHAVFQPIKQPVVNPFADISADDPYFDAVMFVNTQGLMTGTDKKNTTFHPCETATRATLLTVLWRLSGEPVVNYYMPYTDVAEDQWYSEAIRWAASVKLIEDAETFGPDEVITREEAAALLYRYAKHTDHDVSIGENTNILSYADAFDISEYAIPAIQWICGAKLLEDADGYLHPHSALLRHELAEILYRFCT